MRIVPIAITAAFLAMPMQMEIVVQESTALAKGVSATGFGNHERPWAQDMLSDPADPAGAPALPAATQAPAPVPEAAQTTAGKACQPQSEETRYRLARLQAAETRIARQIEDLTELRGSIEELLARQEEAEKQDLQQLVNLYRNMKPGEAAAILSELELPIVVSVILAMREREAAPILANMPRARAQDVTREIARRRSLEKLDVSRL